MARVAADPHDDDGLDEERTHSRDAARDASAWSDELRGDAWIAEPGRRRGREPCNCERDDLVRVLASAPPVATVVTAAHRAAGVAGDHTPSWRTRSRMAALVPSLTVRAGNSESWRDVTDPTVSHAVAFGASIAWRLDRLVFDPSEPRFAAYDVSRRRERRRIAQLASRAYYRWIEAAAAAIRDDRWQLVLLEAGAELDAVTDGWFSRVLAK